MPASTASTCRADRHRLALGADWERPSGVDKDTVKELQSSASGGHIAARQPAHCVLC